MPTSAAQVRVAYTNLGQRTTISGRPWAARIKTAADHFRKHVRASAYLLAETDDVMAETLARALGWGSAGKPCWRTDENRNTVIVDPGKWYDLGTDQASLSSRPGDLADRHYRSASWWLVQHLATGARVWLGASHLSNGGDSTAAAGRESQARVLAASRPQGAPLLLGIDRNSLPGSNPARILGAGGLPLLTPGLRDSFTGNGIQSGTGPIDGLHGTVTIRHVDQVTVPYTDHTVIVAGITIPKGDQS